MTGQFPQTTGTVNHHPALETCSGMDSNARTVIGAAMDVTLKVLRAVQLAQTLPQILRLTMQPREVSVYAQDVKMSSLVLV